MLQSRRLPALRRSVSVTMSAAVIALLAACSSANMGPQSMVDIGTANAQQANITSLSDVIRQRPNDPGPYNVRGTAYAAVGQYQSALDDFNAA